MLGLFALTITVFHIRKDRDTCRHNWEICRNLLEEETKNLQLKKEQENKQTISCEECTETPEPIVSITPPSGVTAQPLAHRSYSISANASNPHRMDRFIHCVI